MERLKRGKTRKGDIRTRHVSALSAVVLASVAAQGVTRFAAADEGLAIALAVVLPVLAGAVAYLGFSRPTIRASEALLTSFAAERDGAREQAARLRGELGKLEGARRDAEAARRFAEAEATKKTDYLSTISKEVRTPLTGVIGMTELLAETRLDDEQTALVETARQSAEALKSVLADVMEFAALESGEIELEDAPFDMREVAEEAIAAHLPAARAKGVEIVFDAAPGLMTQSRGDAARVGRMVSILLGNAVKFTERGEIVLSLASRDRSGSAEMKVEISDTGSGISKEDQARIFEPFVQGDEKAAERYGGTGLGLAIAARLAKLMSGRIEVRSEPGRGSRFTLSFAYRMRHTARGAPAGPDLRNRRYLVIDDSRPATVVLERQLRHWGADVLTASGVEDGEDILWASLADGPEIDAVFLDMTLSGAEGASIAARIGEKASDVRVVLLSPGDPRAAQAAVADGLAVAYLEKPMSPSALAEAVALVSHAGAEGAPAKKARPAQDANAALAPACIVIADDNATNRILIEKFLSEEPMTLIHAPDGVGAVESWADWAPDLILMDVSMPRMDGLEATRRIRALERSEGLVRVPIIALTAKAMADDRERCLEAGMDDYVTKPIRKAELKSKITEWTRSRSKKTA